MNEKSRRYRRHGRLLDERTIQFERILPGPIEVVWDYLTKREHLATWLVENDIPPNPGERIALTQDSEHVPIRVSGEIHARITRARPPHLLAFTWHKLTESSRGAPRAQARASRGGQDQRHSEVVFELESLSGGGSQNHVRLTLTHRRLPPGHIPQAGAGWHAHLEFLSARLEAKPRIPNFFSLYEEVLPDYVKALLKLRNAKQSDSGSDPEPDPGPAPGEDREP